MTASHSSALPHGTCTLVGAGPGDPELLTIKAAKAIAAASVLFVDDLVSDAIVAHARLRPASSTWASAAAARARPRPLSKS
jgi:siroheme synthase